MKKVFMILVGLLVIAIISVCLYAALLPSQYTISRSLVVRATPEKIFPWINDTRKSNEWMPWAESDPQLQMNYIGPVEGVGAISSWKSEGRMGTGQAEVVESVLNTSVTTKLSYTKPMMMTQMAIISLMPKGDGTEISWSVKGENNFIGRVFCVFMNMDKMVGDEFLKGLQNLKLKVEAP